MDTALTALTSAALIFPWSIHRMIARAHSLIIKHMEFVSLDSKSLTTLELQMFRQRTVREREERTK